MKSEMTEERLTDLLSRSFPRERSYLLPALHLIHEKLGFLEEWSLEVAAKYLRVPVSEVWGCATSYTELRLERPADEAVRICTGLSCILRGSKNLLSTANEILKQLPDKTTTVEEIQCGFLCAVAPILHHKGRWIAKASGEDLIKLMKEGDDG